MVGWRKHGQDRQLGGACESRLDVADGGPPRRSCRISRPGPDPIRLVWMVKEIEQNNLSYLLRQIPIWSEGFYAASFSEYDMGAIRARTKRWLEGRDNEANGEGAGPP